MLYMSGFGLVVEAVTSALETMTAIAKSKTHVTVLMSRGSHLRTAAAVGPLYKIDTLLVPSSLLGYSAFFSA